MFLERVRRGATPRDNCSSPCGGTKKGLIWPQVFGPESGTSKPACKRCLGPTRDQLDNLMFPAGKMIDPAQSLVNYIESTATEDGLQFETGV